MMRKRGSIVCKLRPCLPKGPANFARMRTIVTAALQRQYLQTELILWIRLVNSVCKYFRCSAAVKMVHIVTDMDRWTDMTST
jgi:hypothetical protein